jgi:co-chaperonin GroES (HSP10)
MTDTATRGVLLNALQCAALPDHDHCNAAECPDGQHSPAHCILSATQLDFVTATHGKPEDSPPSKPYVTQRIVPAPGRMVVVRERAKKTTYGGLFKPDETTDWEDATNPFAMVVGVGAERPNAYGPPETTDCVEGDKVVVGAIGRPIELVSDGVLDFVYVISFESVVGRLELVCGACGHVERHSAHQAKCQKCGAGPAPEILPEPDSAIIAPTPEDVQRANISRIQSRGTIA